MKSRALAYMTVGLLAVVVFVATYRIILFVKKTGGAEGTPLVAYFSDATGLVEKSRVQIAGLHLGQIVERKFVDVPPREELIAQKRFARVRIVIDPEAVVYEDATIFKRTASLLGEFYLEIDPGTAKDPVTGKPRAQLKPGDEILRVQEAVTTDTVLRKVEEMIPSVRGIADDIRLMTQPGGAIPSIVNNVDETVEQNKETITKLIKNLEVVSANLRDATRGTGNDIRQIVDDVRAITSELRSTVTSPEGDIKGTTSSIRDTATKLNSAMEKLDRTMDNLAEITDAINQGEGTVGRLVRDEELIDEVESTVHEAGEFVRSVTRLRTIVGLRSEYNVQANTLKSYVSLRLQPRIDKYFLIEFVDDPRGTRDTTEILEETDDPSRPQRSRTVRTETSDAFRFTFQFAKRLLFRGGASTFRFGIKESTGGLGADFHIYLPGRQVLELENDIFDFSANRFPRLKSLLAWEFIRNVYLVGGIDDALNDRPRIGAGGGRDYFVGAQLRFDDEDLRGLLFVGGSTISSATGD